uniref:ELKS/RAB6-interacting/CAST family member 2 n=1 Tax=Xenopus tropicalis TaxID=8364 RepID=F6QZN2_XENTR
MYGSARTIASLEGSPSRSPRLPRSPRLGHRRTSSGGGGGAGKTLSMENIQSLNAAYATSGPMYLSDHEGVASTTYPKGTMTLGRASNRAMYGGRVTAMGSSPNIASAGLTHTDVLSYTDHMGLTSASHHHHHHHIPSMLRQVRDSTLLDLQVQLKDFQRENELLRKELDIKDSKLGSSMNSIKTFWSPELKKERVLRKEEAARMSVLKEQMRVSNEENQHLQLTIQALQDELRTQRDLNHLLQQESGNRGGEHFTIELTEDNFRTLQAEHDRQAKELFLLRKTLEEMELRIETQKQTLSARDESIKKLLEMLQSKGLPSKGMDMEENEKTRRMVEAESQLNHLEVLLDQKDKENIHLREELHRRNQLHPESAKTKALQTVIEMKDTKIASLERNIRDLEDEIQMIKTNGVLNTEDREEEIKQMEVYKSHSKFMKSKIDQLKQELSKKETELLALQTKLETLGNQNSDCKQHIEVLKESLTAKEQRAAILQTEVATRLELKFQNRKLLNKKLKNVKTTNIENLQEQLKDKDKQLSNLKDRVKSLQTDSSNTDTALATLEEALSEKERIIERLKEQRERDDRERLEEIENYKKENKDLKEKINALQSELNEKEASLIDLKEHATTLASSGVKRDSKLKSLEMAIEQKREECNKLEAQLKKAHEAEEESRMNPDFSDRLKQLDNEVSYYREECSKAQAEVDRLLQILKEVENEKNDKDNQIAELERLMKDQNKKVANLKHNQQMEKKKNAQLMEDARRRDDNIPDNAQQMQIEELMNALDKTRQELDSTKNRLSSSQQSLAEKEAHLSNLRMERKKQMEEILDMKIALNSKKSKSGLGLLQLHGSRRNNRLAETQTQNRMKLIADNYEDDHHHHHYHHHHHHHRSPGRAQHPNHRPSPEQVRIWLKKSES